jgi:hypothetical protein
VIYILLYGSTYSFILRPTLIVWIVRCRSAMGCVVSIADPFRQSIWPFSAKHEGVLLLYESVSNIIYSNLETLSFMPRFAISL